MISCTIITIKSDLIDLSKDCDNRDFTPIFFGNCQYYSDFEDIDLNIKKKEQGTKQRIRRCLLNEHI